ncbi:hypothetical protein VTK26DRAFT_4524 [Humicola hyalothermophila]
MRPPLPPLGFSFPIRNNPIALALAPIGLRMASSQPTARPSARNRSILSVQHGDEGSPGPPSVPALACFDVALGRPLPQARRSTHMYSIRQRLRRAINRRDLLMHSGPGPSGRQRTHPFRAPHRRVGQLQEWNQQTGSCLTHSIGLVPFPSFCYSSTGRHCWL